MTSAIAANAAGPAFTAAELAAAGHCYRCAEACRRAKGEGHRDWRDRACFEHAAVDLDEYLAANAQRRADAVPEQKDLFDV